uniref:jouberin-like n=1 Tax=Gasterosteus aculeatus aculeatus TaxID=481459 RepID=UPI001A97EECE|nr:jouberin-like [Gasterosteus aculeatus aculeatus]
MQHRSSWQKELNLNQGDLIQVLFKEDEAWWFGQRSDGKEGYFPAACVEPLQGGDSSRAPPMLLRRGSVPVATMTEAAPSGGARTGFPRLLRKTSLRRQLGLDGNLAPLAPPPQGSPSLLHRVLAKSRRKSCPHLPHTGSINTTFQMD